MTSLTLAVVVFLATHLIPGIKPVRAGCVKLLGERLYMGVFSVASIGVVVWLAWAYVEAPYIEIWPYQPEMRWIALLSMPVACFLIVTGISSSNPFSLGPGSKSFNPARPGIVAVCKHPALWGILVWAVAHMVVNGDGASLMVFGLMVLLAAVGPAVLDKKRKMTLGADEWQRLASEVKKVPKSAAFKQIGRFRFYAALCLYALLLYAHGPLIGVSPLDG